MIDGRSYIGIDVNGLSPNAVLIKFKVKPEYCKRLSDDMHIEGAKYKCDVLEVSETQTDAEEAHHFWVSIEKPYYNQFVKTRYIFNNELNSKPLH